MEMYSRSKLSRRDNKFEEILHSAVFWALRLDSDKPVICDLKKGQTSLKQTNIKLFSIVEKRHLMCRDSMFSLIQRGLGNFRNLDKLSYVVSK